MNAVFSRIAILIPSFNPNHNLFDLVLGLSSNPWNEIIVVNDGSSEESQIFFDNFEFNLFYIPKHVFISKHPINIKMFTY